MLAADDHLLLSPEQHDPAVAVEDAQVASCDFGDGWLTPIPSAQVRAAHQQLAIARDANTNTVDGPSDQVPFAVKHKLFLEIDAGDGNDLGHSIHAPHARRCRKHSLEALQERPRNGS